MNNCVRKFLSLLELSLLELSKFIDNIHDKYEKSLQKYRNNKKFIYTLIGVNDTQDREYINKWEECEFSSTRRFDNLFFENKKILINKLDFFVNNKNYYEREGHPYTFGIGLHGPPGTGKTSIIKCIANKLNRHIIVIPLSKIKTQREFSEYFFEKYYTRNNSKKIDFKDKIIVFEDIDCMSEIVKRRDLNKNKIKEKNSDSEDSDNIENEQSIILSNSFHTFFRFKADFQYNIKSKLKFLNRIRRFIYRKFNI